MNRQTVIRLDILQKQIIRQIFFSAYFSFLELLRPWEADSFGTDANTEELNSLEKNNKKIDWLCMTLRNCPYWAKGHLSLARESLKIHNPELAYASILAFEALCGKNDASIKLLGDCYLQLKDTRAARKFYEKLSVNQNYSPKIRESLVACDLLDGDWKNVLKLLSEIPKSELSVQEMTALNWALGKKEEVKTG